MAKTLKTGDVKRIPIGEFDEIYASDRWAVIGRSDIPPIGYETRKAARHLKDITERIAKIIKRTPKYVFVEVSK